MIPRPQPQRRGLCYAIPSMSYGNDAVRVSASIADGAGAVKWAPTPALPRLRARAVAAGAEHALLLLEVKSRAGLFGACVALMLLGL